METQKINRDTFIKLRDFIYEKCGIYFPENKGYLLEARLIRRLRERNLSSYEEYFYFLRYDPKREEELKELFNSITTNETSFFRDAIQLETFRKRIIPAIVKENTMEMIKIWSAGCSTGEEPYTIAIIMMEESFQLKGKRVSILASDISEQVLHSAKRATYGEYTLRNLPERYLKRYFIKTEKGYAVRPEIKQLVRFVNINLIDSGQMREIRGMDVIFCRNVLIYFGDKAKKKVVGYLYDSLREGGYLILGASESLFNISRAFRPLVMDRCIVYQKK